MVKSPAFQVYAADFLADKNTAVMTAEEVGAYWLLILYCWREGSIPDDFEELAALSRVPLERFETSWERRIKRCFLQREDGCWIHPRLESERQHQAENREKKRHAALTRHRNGSGEGLPQSNDADAVQVHSTRSAGAYQTQSTCNADAVHVICPSASASASASTAYSEANASAPEPAARRPASVIWDLGVEMLKRAGYAEKRARSFLGEQVKAFDKDQVATAIAITSAQNPTDPIAYLTKVLYEQPGSQPAIRESKNIRNLKESFRAFSSPPQPDFGADPGEPGRPRLALPRAGGS